MRVFVPLPTILVLFLLPPYLTAQEDNAAPPPSTVKVAGVVLKWLREDKEANFRRLEPLVREAAAGGAKIVSTTECFLDGYAIADKSIPLDRYRALGEKIPGGPFFEKLARLADALDVYLIAGMLEADGEHRFNTAVVLAPDGALIGKYRKQELGHELGRNTPGAESPVFATPFGKIGVMICADRRERALVGRLCERGADFLICPSGGMFGPERNDPIVQARSRETRRHIIFVHPAEFLVTGPDGTIVSRTILGDRLLIEPEQIGGEPDRNRVFYFDLPLVASGGEAPAPPDLATVLERTVLEADQPLRDVQAFTEARVAELPAFESAEAFELYAARLRRDVLERVVLRGEAGRWRAATAGVRWLETIDAADDYRIRKLRFEALPGLWVPALLYEPKELSEKHPVVLNVNGHDGAGKAAPYKQIRCINQAKRGMLALNLEWLGMGQLRTDGFAHYRMNQLDLCGTSGLAPFYLAMERGLDLLLAHEHADPGRVAVAGLSGGGWQTIVFSALDTRVTLANPVAGYGSYRTRVHHFADLGDSEQTPVELASIADYTHLTALLAPRRALLTYNAADDCCFRAGHTLPPLLDAATPVYRLFGAEDLLRVHVNHDPGTHNFERENREALYAALGDEFHPGDGSFRREEIDCADDVRTKEDLAVELPEDNTDFHRLALALAAELPRAGKLPSTRDEASIWQGARLVRLREVVRAADYTVEASELEATGDEAASAAPIRRWRLRLGGAWTVPVVEIGQPEATYSVVVLADEGRASASDIIDDALGEGARVLALDPFYLGESRISQKDFLFALLISSVGERPLGVQASQVAAVCSWLQGRYPDQDVRLEARGPRTSLIALVAAAMTSDPASIDRVTVEGSYGSLREVIERNLAVNATPELFCFGLLAELDVLHIAALTAPRRVRFHAPNERVRAELAPLADWYRTLGREFDPLE